MDMIASRLGTWIVGSKYEDLPPQVVTRAKFYGLTEGLLPREQIEPIVRRVDALEALQDVSELVVSLRR